MSLSSTHSVRIHLVQAVVMVALGVAPVAGGQTQRQTDWSGGPGAEGPTAEWETRFAISEGVSWRALPGQLALTSTPAAEITVDELESGAGQPSSLAVADLDGDGDLDVVRSGFADGRIVWLRRDAARWSALTVVEGFTQAAAVRAADLDGDGDPDVIGASLRTDTVAWWQNTGPDPDEWVRHDLSTDVDGAHGVEVADMDLDGDLDVVIAAARADRIAWYESSGGPVPSWTPHPIAEGFDGARAALPVDLDLDGDLDVVGAALVGDSVVWWRNDGGGTSWTAHEVDSSFNGAHGVAVSDLDDDGLPDIVGAGFTSARLVWWRNEGGSPPTWRRSELPGLMVGALTADIADLDGDGDLDIVAAAETSDRVRWWQNDDGVFTERVVADQVDGPWPVRAVDLDGDGRLEVVAGVGFAGQVVAWDVTDYGSAGWIEGTPLVLAEDAASCFARWQARLPSATALEVSLRWWPEGADGPTAWRPVLADEMVSLSADRPTAIQYRLDLGTVDPEVSPVVEELTLEIAQEVGPVIRRGDRRRLPSP